MYLRVSLFITLLLCISLQPAYAVKLRFPILNPGGEFVKSTVIIGFDHDPVYYGEPEFHCLNYDGKDNFPYCYGF